MKIYKIYLKALLLIPMLMMAFLSVINYVADPFQIYHDSFLNKGRYIKQQERFQNAGLIRELWRDESCCTSLMLGTSMSQNFDGAKIGSILKSGNVLN
ncbi:MAG TPA: hypothetical protein VL943_02495, partial [Niabella sp.]|nr:hypothetical protein [Niabella sp.]